ncbi:choice-of-anchor Q domain-containing protein [Planctomycetota bacterium]
MIRKKTSLFCLLILLTAAGLAQADNYFVNCFIGDDDADGGIANPKRTIQAAIDLCLDGDSVFVADGVYTGIGNRNIDFSGKKITLRSENGPAYCIIDCRAGPANPLRAFSFENAENADSVLNGFTITNGFGWGAGIFCQNSSPTIINCIIDGNSSPSKGGAIACNNADPNIFDCTITNNSAVDNGGGIYCQNSQPIFRNCIISHNRVTGGFGLGGGICCEQNSFITLKQCILNGNRAGAFGGAAYSLDSDLTMINCLITGNRADSYGGAIYCKNSRLQLISSTLSDNYAQYFGGAIQAYLNSVVTITNSILWADSSENGPELALVDNAQVTVSYSNIQGGRLVYKDSSVLTWDQTNIGQNIKDDPLFAQPGYWDPNGTFENLEDDFWVNGDYRLLPRSPAIDRGANAALAGHDKDIEENTRIVNGLTDLGAYETGLIITKLIVKTPKNRQDLQDPADFFSLAGAFDAPGNVFDNSTQMDVYVGPYPETITLNLPLFKQLGDKPIFIYKRRLQIDEPGAIAAMKFNLRNGKFSILARNIDLSGLEAPFDVALRIGDGYYRSAAVGEIVANGRKKPLPMLLMMGLEDSLRLYKEPKLKPNKLVMDQYDYNYLLLQGGISLAQPPVSLLNKRLDIRWGTYQDFIPTDGWITNITGDKFIYKKKVADTTPNYVNLALIDFKKCTFKIIIKNAPIGHLPAPQNLTISFDGFEETVRPPFLR